MFDLFLFTSTIGDEYALPEGSITCISNIFSISSPTTSFIAKGSGYGINLMDVSVVVLFSCSSKSVKPGLSVKTSGNSFTKFLPLASLNH